MISVPGDRNEFRFSADLSMTRQTGDIIKKTFSVCVDNSRDLSFQATRSVVQIVLGQLCADIFRCATRTDMRNFEDDHVVFELSTEGVIFTSDTAKESDGRTDASLDLGRIIC